MELKDGELLLKDLCARLPYGVIVKEQYGDYIQVNLYNAHLEHLIDRISLGLDKLVLRPMSSMTDEEYKEYDKLPYFGAGDLEQGIERLDFLYSHHFDVRGLIEKGLAIEVTEENNPYKE